MSPLPVTMVDRWLNRIQPGSNQGVVWWHVLLGDDVQMRAAAAEAQEALAGFQGLHMTPLKRLHISLLAAGSTNEIDRTQMLEMLIGAEQSLLGVAPLPITLDRVLYHPEAIALRVRPAEGLSPIVDAVQSATERVTHQSRPPEVRESPWIPHVTVSYSTATQAAEPIIEKLGKSIQERQALVDSVSLVIQWGSERLWNWELIGAVQLGRGLGTDPTLVPPVG